MKIFLHLVLCLIVVVLHSTNAAVVPAVFILGDSTADVGTNNFLPGSNIKVNFPPYGIDFPHSIPTGRFSNGLNSADFLAKLTGFKRSPLPFLALANNTQAFKGPGFRGANFASGGSGILDITGKTMLNMMKSGKDYNAYGIPANTNKNVVPLSEQIKQFFNVYGYLNASKGAECAQSFLSKSLVVFSIGSNDLFVYYHSNSTVPKEQFISSLTLAYESHLRKILQLGAKKLGIISVPPIGCCPSQRIFNTTTGGCLEDLNDLARAFHVKINALMRKLSSEYPDMKYSLGNAYEMTINVIDHPGRFGFKDVKTPCCGAGQASCNPNSNVCSERRENLFWDLFHPTMTASQLAAYTLFTGGPRFVGPINFKQLIEA